MSRLTPTAQGIILMLCAIFMFSTMDALAKYLATRYDVVQVVWARYAGQMAVVVLVLAPRLRQLIHTNHLGLQLIRSGFLYAATFCFFTSLSYMDMAVVIAVANIHPVLLTLGAALILREALGPRRIIGIVAAMIGALIIIRPGADVFALSSLLPLLAGFFYASYALSTRFLGRDEPILTSFLYTALIGTLVSSVMVIPAWQMPSLTDAGIFLVLGAVAALGQFMLIKSLTLAEAGAVAPFGYAGIVFATLWGFFAFDEVPDVWTLVGAAVIICAGIYVWHRETQARAGAS
ncbi:MAG: DMT family transporter [Pseudomonadota bacterium]